MLRLHSLEKAQASHVYTYSSSFQGFAAKLNKEQARRLAGNFITHGFWNVYVALYQVSPVVMAVMPRC